MERLDSFLRTSEVWLNWSYLESHWKENDSAEVKSAKAIRLTVAYVTGMAGHVLCGATKIVECALFIIVSLGFALKLGYEYFLCRWQNKENPGQCVKELKYRLYQGLLITGGSLVAATIDLFVGAVCPPIAYRLHNFMCEEAIFSALSKWGIVEYSKKDSEFNLSFTVMHLIR